MNHQDTKTPSSFFVSWCLCGGLVLLFLGLAGLAATPAKRKIGYSDIPAQLRQNLGVSAEGFEEFVRSIEKRTEERMRLGENDHLVAYLLQSQRFTTQPRIEPALSAYEFAGNLTAEERDRYLSGRENYPPPIEKIPKFALRRMQDFIRVAGKPAAREDERLSHFQTLLRASSQPPDSLLRYLSTEYARSMRFLYQKEFLARAANPSEKGSPVASLYQERGHSTDTQVEANFAVFMALSVLKALGASGMGRVLIVGPGLDFAPRTDLMDVVPPQSYQPFAVADALLGLQLANPSRLRIHCVDINDRVIQYLKEFPKRKVRQLTIFPGVKETAKRSWTAEFQDYFQNLGRNVGREGRAEAASSLPESRLQKILLVRRDVAERISAERMNILTARYEPSPQYDLVVVTNVLTYLNSTELLLALTNIYSMMKPGGYLIHNELREEVEAFGKALGLEPIQARTLRLSVGEDTPLFDGFAIHKKM